MTIYLTSPGTDWAGLYGPNAIITTSGQAVSGITPTFNRTVDGVTPGPSWTTFYTDYTRGTPAVAPTTDDQGNLQFWTDPGLYLMTFTLPGSAPTTVPITVQPFYPDAAWNVLTVPASATAVSGNVQLVNAASAPITITLPAPSPGARVKVVKTDSSAFPVNVVVADASLLLGPATGTGYPFQPTMTIYGQGGALEFISDGTNYHLTGTNNRRIGVVDMFAGSSAAVPAGALLCNGGSYNQADYPELWHVIGGQYGSSGSTFNVPNFTGQSPVGGTAGTYYGAPYHTLLNTDLPDHSHANPGLEYVIGISGSENNSINDTPGASSGPTGVTFANYTGSAAPAQSTNVPTVTPSLGINFIIWAQ